MGRAPRMLVALLLVAFIAATVAVPLLASAATPLAPAGMTQMPGCDDCGGGDEDEGWAACLADCAALQLAVLAGPAVELRPGSSLDLQPVAMLVGRSRPPNPEPPRAVTAS